MNQPALNDAPIGIFDSGVGGLTVARAILDQLPNESTMYIGDTARGPYGPRPLAEVRTFALEALDYLVDQGVKAIVIACNTASAAMAFSGVTPTCRAAAIAASAFRRLCSPGISRFNSPNRCPPKST